mmetsp:Transcript_9871/g.16348  ORF Transcript_9871/g.16348 Transcript_9871/m.16348 type:complete len:123 (-) Transcript_9871:846-1214(-)
MAAPANKRLLGDFQRVHNGELVIPWPTLFIGGNHRCYGWLDQDADVDRKGCSVASLMAPNLFYLGRAGFLSLRFGRRHGGPAELTSFSTTGEGPVEFQVQPEAIHEFLQDSCNLNVKKNPNL